MVHTVQPRLVDVADGDWALPTARPRPVSLRFLIGLMLLLATLFSFVNPSVVDAKRWFWPLLWLEEATDGLMNLTLSGSLVWFVIVVCGVLMGFGGQTPRMLGLDPKRLPIAAVATLAVVVAVVGVNLAVGLWRNGDIVWNPAWTSGRWTAVTGRWLAQFLGVGLFEEVVMRGFLIGQVYLLAGRWYTSRPRWRLAISLFVSQGVFAILHVPHNLASYPMGESMLLVVLQFLAGLVLAGVYVGTGNLWLTIALHALINSPPGPISEQLQGGMVPGLITVGLALVLLVRGLRARDLPHRTRT